MLKMITPPLRVIALVLFLALFSFNAIAQKEISGKIENSKDKQPIAGVTVIVKGSKVATQTNIDGTFKLNAPNDQSVLLITAVGFETQEISMSGKSAVVVELKEMTIDFWLTAEDLPSEDNRVTLKEDGSIKVDYTRTNYTAFEKLKEQPKAAPFENLNKMFTFSSSCDRRKLRSSLLCRKR